MCVDRGDLVWINLNPQAGHEQTGRRPAIVLSPKAFNVTTGFVSVCRLQVKGDWPTNSSISGFCPHLLDTHLK